jgi:hypothetical protein
MQCLFGVSYCPSESLKRTPCFDAANWSPQHNCSDLSSCSILDGGRLLCSSRGWVGNWVRDNPAAWPAWRQGGHHGEERIGCTGSGSFAQKPGGGSESTDPTYQAPFLWLLFPGWKSDFRRVGMHPQTVVVVDAPLGTVSCGQVSDSTRPSMLLNREAGLEGLNSNTFWSS